MGGIAAVDVILGIIGEVGHQRVHGSFDHTVVAKKNIIAVIRAPGDDVAAGSADDHVAPLARRCRPTVNHVISAISAVVDTIFKLAG